VGVGDELARSLEWQGQITKALSERLSTVSLTVIAAIRDEGSARAEALSRSHGGALGIDIAEMASHLRLKANEDLTPYKAHKGKSRRGQLPGLATDRRGYAIKSNRNRRSRYRRAKQES